MRKTECMTFPRSGHHALVRCLQHYFGDELKYCTVDQPEQMLVDAGIYSHGLIGEDPLTNLQKNHDFGLKTPLLDDRQYLIQYRDPVESIASLYRMRVASGEIEPHSREGWERFAFKQAKYWRRFLRKWVIKNRYPLTTFLSYEQLVGDPVARVGEVVRFVASDGESDAERVREAVEAVGIKRYNTAATALYYDEDFFAKLARRCRKEVGRAPGLET